MPARSDLTVGSVVIEIIGLVMLVLVYVLWNGVNGRFSPPRINHLVVECMIL